MIPLTNKQKWKRTNINHYDTNQISFFSIFNLFKIFDICTEEEIFEESFISNINEEYNQITIDKNSDLFDLDDDLINSKIENLSSNEDKKFSKSLKINNERDKSPISVADFIKVSNKKLTICSTVKVILIPTIKELKEAELFDNLWWSNKDYDLFLEEAKISKMIKNF